MQISGFPVVVPTTPSSQRGDIAERVQKDVTRENNRDYDAERTDSSLEELRFRDENSQQQRIEAQNEVRRVNASRQQASEQFPLSTQRALQAFASNGPTSEQPLGIELVGVDTFV